MPDLSNSARISAAIWALCCGHTLAPPRRMRPAVSGCCAMRGIVADSRSRSAGESPAGPTKPNQTYTP